MLFVIIKRHLMSFIILLNNKNHIQYTLHNFYFTCCISDE